MPSTIKRLLTLILITLAATCLHVQRASALSVEDVRFGLHEDKIRLVLDLSERTDFRAFVLDQPYRLMIDLKPFAWNASTPAGMKQVGAKDLRYGNLQPGVSRIVFDFSYPLSISTAFTIPAQNGKPNRLVIDFVKVDPQSFTSAKTTLFGTLNPQAMNTALAAPPPPEPEPRAQTPSPSGKKPLIVIDAGHGGVDPGATAANGVFEKNITLQLSRELQQKLEETGQYRVILTRDSDVFIKLSERVNFARRNGADLFISIHADSINKGNVKGVSVYTLSETASDEQTAKLAARENKADLIAGIDLSVEDEDVANILVDLAMRDTMNQSKYFANKIVSILQSEGVVLLESPHRYAGFAVLKAPDIPSILVEAGFLSNQKEAELLNTKAYRSKIVNALKHGVEAYFEQARKNQRI